MYCDSVQSVVKVSVVDTVKEMKHSHIKSLGIDN